jgi:hypothetical protein
VAPTVRHPLQPAASMAVCCDASNARLPHSEGTRERRVRQLPDHVRYDTVSVDRLHLQGAPGAPRASEISPCRCIAKYKKTMSRIAMRVFVSLVNDPPGLKGA